MLRMWITTVDSGKLCSDRLAWKRGVASLALEDSLMVKGRCLNEHKVMVDQNLWVLGW
jgi:hypothetical protein